jgi:hypothetical protein
MKRKNYTAGGYTFTRGEPSKTVQKKNTATDRNVIATAKKTGKAIFYVFGRGSNAKIDLDKLRVGTWTGKTKWSCTKARSSHHNFAGRNGRLDLWWNIDNQKWHGVNIGDNDIVRAKVIK